MYAVDPFNLPSYRVEEDIISSRYRKKQGRKERNIF
jgi:hypothetical protein